MAKINSEWEQKPTTHKEECHLCGDEVKKGETRLRNKLNFASVIGANSICMCCIQEAHINSDEFQTFIKNILKDLKELCEDNEVMKETIEDYFVERWLDEEEDEV